MAEEPITDACVVCGGDLPPDPPTETVPEPVGARLSPLSSPGVRKLAFCSERHRRDWIDGQRGDWGATSSDATGDDDGTDDAEADEDA